MEQLLDGPPQTKYHSAVIVSALVKFIAAYNDTRMFNWLLTVRLVLIEILLVMKLDVVQAKYKSAVIVSGLLTCIAACHYMRIFNWLLTARLLLIDPRVDEA